MSHNFNRDVFGIGLVTTSTPSVCVKRVQFHDVSGATEEDALRAFTLGAEIACRMAMSVTPEHYDAGWHITSTAGVFGSIAAASILLDLSEEEVISALGIGGTTAAGVREAFGSDVKVQYLRSVGSTCTL